MSRSVEFRPTFGAFILETLTLGMYGETKIAIREYVQNAFDSLQEAVARDLVRPDTAEVEVLLGSDRQSLIIRDNGMGMRTESATEILASVGASNKSYSKNAGFRGIGRLAGIVFCNRLVFSTKAAGQNERTTVEIDAKELRKRLAPESGNTDDAAQTLAACVTARIDDSGNEEAAHYFEVRLEGYHEPPAEATDIASLKSFLQQVSPLPFSASFPFVDKIATYAKDVTGGPIDSIHVFVKDGDRAREEIFKPFESHVLVKTKNVPISDVDLVRSETGKWWGWVGRKKTSGAIKNVEVRGIRVRMKNIQIDDVQIMREIFALSKKSSQQRLSYLRFAEWYVGEIHISPSAAVPNARRDGFEENEGWHELRGELEDVAIRYGRAAYKTSKGDQLSIENLSRLYASLKASVEGLQPGNWDRLSMLAAEAIGIQNRLAQAAAYAEDDEKAVLRDLHAQNLALKARIQESIVEGPPMHDCEAEIAQAKADLARSIFTALRDRLGPSEWRRAMQVVKDVTGEAPRN